MTSITTSSLAITIDDGAWQQLVTYTPEPEYETERLHQLVRLALTALAASTRHDIITGIFCLPADGSMTTPLWQPLQLSLRGDVVNISLAG